ncbi:MAG: hypothetical protein RLY61_292 [Candidatus Parcubacteria bacterium]|jgi:hypothetical protein
MDKSEFLQDVVNGWMKGDLERMIRNIRPDPNESGNINFPLALCTLSYMEYLGSFLLGVDKGYINNVDEYIKICFKNPSEYPAQILYDLMRNGLAHDYFPRCAISRNGKHPAIYRGQSFDIVLDAETLITDFISSLNKFGVLLQDDKFTKRITETIKKINDWKNKHHDYIEHLVVQEGDGTHATPSVGYMENMGDTGMGYYTTKNSGASGLQGPITNLKPISTNEYNNPDN